MFSRYYDDLNKYIKPGKVLVILGPRQVGKTTLLKNYLKNCNSKYRFDSGELLNIQKTLSSQNLDVLKKYTEGYEIIAIDEAHKIPNIGLNLKIMVDHMPNIKVLVTGSSSFDLLGQVGEPLVGRKITLRLFPLSQLELKNKFNEFELKSHLEDWLLYGGYPEVVATRATHDKIQLLNELTQSYMLNDILELEKVKSSKILVDLLTLLAFQIGHEVSLSELGKNLGINYKTVARYLDLLEKSFVLYRLGGFSRNLRKEITKKDKYYFFDNGIRNSLISNFNSFDKRNDIGALWENFLVMERLKKQEYQNIYGSNYFWRTWNGEEVDWVEERDGMLHGYEFKWRKSKVKLPKTWQQTYDNASFTLVNKDNYLSFIT